MPDKATVFRWLAAKPDFRDQYACAREAQADAMAEDILEIADDGSSDTFEDGNGWVNNYNVVAEDVELYGYEVDDIHVLGKR